MNTIVKCIFISVCLLFFSCSEMIEDLRDRMGTDIVSENPDGTDNPDGSGGNIETPGTGSNADTPGTGSNTDTPGSANTDTMGSSGNADSSSGNIENPDGSSDSDDEKTVTGIIRFPALESTDDETLLNSKEVLEYGKTYKISAPEQYDTYNWYLDGIRQYPVAGSEYELEINTTSMEKRNYTLLLIVSLDGVEYSATCLLIMGE